MAGENTTPKRLMRSPEALWDAWSFAAMEAQLAFDSWMKASFALKRAAFSTYQAALDREEKAAAALAAGLGPSAMSRASTRVDVSWRTA